MKLVFVSVLRCRLCFCFQTLPKYIYSIYIRSKVWLKKHTQAYVLLLYNVFHQNVFQVWFFTHMQVLKATEYFFTYSEYVHSNKNKNFNNAFYTEQVNKPHYMHLTKLALTVAEEKWCHKLKVKTDLSQNNLKSSLET